MDSYTARSGSNQNNLQNALQFWGMRDAMMRPQIDWGTVMGGLNDAPPPGSKVKNADGSEKFVPNPAYDTWQGIFGQMFGDVTRNPFAGSGYTTYPSWGR